MYSSQKCTINLHKKKNSVVAANVSAMCHPCVIHVSSMCHPCVIHVSSVCHPVCSTEQPHSPMSWIEWPGSIEIQSIISSLILPQNIFLNALTLVVIWTRRAVQCGVQKGLLNGLVNGWKEWGGVGKNEVGASELVMKKKLLNGCRSMWGRVLISMFKRGQNISESLIH